MSFLVPSRRTDEEILDRTGNAEADLAAAFDDIRTVNRRLNGSKLLLEAVDPFLDWASAGETFEILDVGSGGGDLLLDLAAHVRARGSDVRIVGIDRDPATARIARKACAADPAIEIVEADAFRLPYPDKRFDVVTLSLFLHHLEYQEGVVLVRRLLKLARKAVVVNDLRRHLVPWAFIAIAARVARAHPMFVHDAARSVLRGFTEEEMLALCQDVGAPMATVQRRWPYRLVATLPAR